MPSAALCTPFCAAFALPQSRVAVYLMYIPQTSTSDVHKKPIIPDDMDILSPAVLGNRDGAMRLPL
jgi:hypothetical protein